MSVAVSDIELRGLVLADLQNAAYITQYDRHAAINEGYRYLYNLLLNNDDDYYVTEVTPTVTSSYTLPADFMRLRAVDYLYGGRYLTVRKYTMEERNVLDENSSTVEPMYREHGSTIRIIPQARAFDMRIWYYPIPNTLISSSVVAWLTTTAYKVGNMVSNGGSYYVCMTNHTSGTFATDLASGYWSVFSTSGVTTISYPNNIAHEIIAYRSAILYRIKQKAEDKMLDNLKMELARFEKQFVTQIIRDDYKNQKLNDVWSGRLSWR